MYFWNLVLPIIRVALQLHSSRAQQQLMVSLAAFWGRGVLLQGTVRGRRALVLTTSMATIQRSVPGERRTKKG